MRIFRTAFPYVAAALIMAALPAVSRADTLTVPKDTEVALTFDQAFSSKTAKVGDTVKMHVSDNVNVNGRTVINAGTPVTGVITKVEKRKHFGVNAKMQITLDPVTSVAGSLILLEPKAKGNVVGGRTGQAAAASGGGALLLGPVGLVGGYFVVGKQVNVHPGDHLVSQVSMDTTVTMR